MKLCRLRFGSPLFSPEAAGSIIEHTTLFLNLCPVQEQSTVKWSWQERPDARWHAHTLSGPSKCTSACLLEKVLLHPVITMQNDILMHVPECSHYSRNHGGDASLTHHGHNNSLLNVVSDHALPTKPNTLLPAASKARMLADNVLRSWALAGVWTSRCAIKLVERGLIDMCPAPRARASIPSEVARLTDRPDLTHDA